MQIPHIASIISDLSMSTWHLKAEVNVNVHTGVDGWISWVNTLIKSIGLWRPNTGLNICSCQTTDTDWGELQNQSMATVSTQHQALKYETPQYLPGKATQRYMFSVINNNDQSWSRGISIQMRTSNVLYKANYIQCCVYIHYIINMSKNIKCIYQIYYKNTEMHYI